MIITLLIILSNLSYVYAVKHVSSQYEEIRKGMGIFSKIRYWLHEALTPATMVGNCLCSIYPDASGQCNQYTCQISCPSSATCTGGTGGCAIDFFDSNYNFLREEHVSPGTSAWANKNEYWENYYCDISGCSCTKFQDGGCGAGPCNSDEMLRYRTCTPSGCDDEQVCVYRSECTPTTTTTPTTTPTTTAPVQCTYDWDCTKYCDQYPGWYADCSDGWCVFNTLHITGYDYKCPGSRPGICAEYSFAECLANQDKCDWAGEQWGCIDKYTGVGGTGACYQDSDCAYLCEDYPGWYANCGSDGNCYFNTLHVTGYDYKCPGDMQVIDPETGQMVPLDCVNYGYAECLLHPECVWAGSQWGCIVRGTGAGGTGEPYPGKECLTDADCPIGYVCKKEHWYSIEKTCIKAGIEDYINFTGLFLAMIAAGLVYYRFKGGIGIFLGIAVAGLVYYLMTLYGFWIAIGAIIAVAVFVILRGVLPF